MSYGQASQQGPIGPDFAPGRPLPSNNADNVIVKFLLPVVFIGVPIAEIAMFIEVGGLIGMVPTLAAIVATAVVGTAIMRRQGIAVLGEAQRAMDGGRLPIDSVIHGLFLLIAGILLLTPGFLTDAAGFALLVPSVRLAIARWLLERLRGSGRAHIHTVNMGGFDAKATPQTPPGSQGAGPIIEGEAILVEDDDRASGPRKPSPRRW